MDMNIEKYKWMRRFFLNGFLVSLFFAVTEYLLIKYYYPPGYRPNPNISEIPPERMFVLLVITTIISALGFIITTVLALRKERREVKSFALDNEKKELEIQKIKLELQQTKEQNQAPAALKETKKNKQLKGKAKG